MSVPIKINVGVVGEEPIKIGLKSPTNTQPINVSAPIVIGHDIPEYDGPYTVTPSEEAQTLDTDGKKMVQDVTVEAVPSDYVGSAISRQSELSASGPIVTAPAGYYAEDASKTISNATMKSPLEVTANPTISVDANGLVTAETALNTFQNPVKTEGYAQPFYSVQLRVNGLSTQQLPTLSATTYTPGATAQEIAAQQYLTGKQTISAIAPPYYDMSVSTAWMGAGAELVGTFALADIKLSATDFNTWTPSTTATDILATRSPGTFTADGVIDQYDYIIIWETKLPLVYGTGATDVARPLFLAGYHVQELIRRPNSYGNILSGNANNTVNISAFSAGSFLPYYNNNGVQSYTYNASYGFYVTLTANTLSSATAASPTVTLKSPKVTARCSSTYMSTANAGKIDKDKSIISQKAIVYKVKKPAFLQGIYYNIMRLVQETNAQLGG